MSGPLRVAFFAERQVGLNSVAAVVEKYLPAPGFAITWTDVTYREPDGLLEKLPGLPRKLSGTARGYLQTRRGLARGPFDAMVFFSQSPAVFHPGALARTPTCVWTDATPTQLHAMNEAYGRGPASTGLARVLKRRAVTRTYQLARRCLAWSEWVRRSYVRDYGIPEEKTAVVRPGVDLTRWSAPARAPAVGRPFRLLFVGGDFARKGGHLLLEVFRASLRERCLLDVVTREPIAEEPGVRVHRTLSVDSPQLAALYREADAFVLPTRADCHSIAALEAMASGLPVVCGGVGAIPEVVEDGRVGFVIAPEAKPLSDALLFLCGDPARAREMGAAGRALVEARFDARQTAAELRRQLLRTAGRARE